jgi:hypothetical protein
VVRSIAIGMEVPTFIDDAIDAVSAAVSTQHRNQFPRASKWCLTSRRSRFYLGLRNHAVTSCGVASISRLFRFY